MRKVAIISNNLNSDQDIALPYGTRVEVWSRVCRKTKVDDRDQQERKNPMYGEKGFLVEGWIFRGPNDGCFVSFCDSGDIEYLD